jgi:DNA-binding winged helix-turn-helix (wHTH) protein
MLGEGVSMVTATSAQWQTMADSAPSIHAIGPFAFHLLRSELSREGVVVELAPKARRVLAYLIRNQERFVSREELHREIWPGVVVSQGSLTQAVWEIRRALGDSRDSPRFVETRYGLGYRFLAANSRP